MVMSRKILMVILRRLGFKLINLAEKIEANNSVTNAHERWLRDNGDKKLRLDYDILEDDLVIDVGGYEGQWASDIYSKYRCKIHVFEPVKQYAENIKERFSKNQDIKVYALGLGASEREIAFSITGDSSTVISNNDASNVVSLISFKKWCDALGVKEIALIKINIEGGEYELLEHIIECGLVKIIKNIQVQFHNTVENSDRKVYEIQSRLRETHFPTWQYSYVWENWRLIR